MNLKKSETLLALHREALLACNRCPEMHKPVVSGGAVVSRVMLVGQAPGNREPVLGRPFAWTAGKTLFRWFEEECGMSEAQFRARIYMAAVCRCFPGKKEGGGDRVPTAVEISNCSEWMEKEIRLLKPELVIAVGKLAISQFVPVAPLEELVGKMFRVERFGVEFDLVPLPHPSGASPWPRMEPGRSLLKEALGIIGGHSAFEQVRIQSS
ncbi:MAG: uracil-DNA glycosylase family protein [Verrucomicrobiota bacterium]|nr:uracil-DNA glycosylase family protein [Verrucomicrobiota bacterium]